MAQLGRWLARQRSDHPWRYALILGTTVGLLAAAFLGARGDAASEVATVAAEGFAITFVFGGLFAATDPARRAGMTASMRRLAGQRVTIATALMAAFVVAVFAISLTRASLHAAVASTAPFALLAIVWVLLVVHFRRRGHRF